MWFLWRIENNVLSTFFSALATTNNIQMATYRGAILLYLQLTFGHENIRHRSGENDVQEIHQKEAVNRLTRRVRVFIERLELSGSSSCHAVRARCLDRAFFF